MWSNEKEGKAGVSLLPCLRCSYHYDRSRIRSALSGWLDERVSDERDKGSFRTFPLGESD